jgi:hypothetical protein
MTSLQHTLRQPSAILYSPVPAGASVCCALVVVVERSVSIHVHSIYTTSIECMMQRTAGLRQCQRTA